MNRQLLKVVLLLLLLVATITIVVGAWARITHQMYADTILGAGLAGTTVAIVLLGVIFGANNLPSNRM